MHYHRLIALVVLVNAALLARHLARGDWHVADGSALSGMADLIVANLAIAVLIRQQHVLNVIFAVAGRGSSRWPLRVRWTVSKIYHIGGLHVGAALAGTAWLCAFTVVAAVARAQRPPAVDLTTFALAVSLAALMIVIVLCALPPVRARAHDVFELTHRFGGWTTVGLFWAHTFATVSTPGRSGYRMLISRAGDWTARFIDDPPSHLWARGVPTRAPIPAIEVMYRRLVYVVTGSGIGPMLGLILNSRLPGQLVWSTRSPRATYGDALVDEVLAARPDAVIWDTTERGKPDLLPLARDVCRDFAAEAVLVVSNKTATWRLVHGLERLGVPAFGPIWDS